MKRKCVPLIFIFLLSLAYRLNGIFDNHPFWVDEFSSAIQSQILLKYGLSVFGNANVYFEPYNIIPHILIALSFSIFGLTEWAARMPFVIIGSAVPFLAYLFGKRLASAWTGISAAVFAATSYFMIAWSRQARGYMLQVALLIIALLLYDQLVKKYSRKTLAYLIITIILGIFTHTSFVLVPLSLFTHAMMAGKMRLLKMHRRKILILAVPVFLAVATMIGLPAYFANAMRIGSFGANNLWYYHSFLWREYSLITFLGLSGMVIHSMKSRRIEPAFIYSGVYLLFVTYIFKPYSSRYLLPVFSLLLIYTAYTLAVCISAVTTRKYLVLFPVLFIIANGHKFDVKPNRYYSVNHDFRDIALIDYSEMYGIIRSKGALGEGRTAVIDTWWDRARWYVGYDYEPLYTFRWDDAPGLINGIPKHTSYYRAGNDKIVPLTDGVRLISNLTDLKTAMKKYPKGFLFTDDATMSPEVLAYAEKNLKKEWYADKYFLDDNPLSYWPAILYSWGL